MIPKKQKYLVNIYNLRRNKMKIIIRYIIASCKVFIFSVIMPMNGIIITKHPKLGILLILLQIPWFIDSCCIKEK